MFAVAPIAMAVPGDEDNDGLNNTQEYNSFTNPHISDTDGDGLSDGEEVNTYKTVPSNWDTDGDNLADGREINYLRTDPKLKDTNGDGFVDAEPGFTKTPPPPEEPAPGRPNDRDSDGLLDDDETNVYSTNPDVADTDGDGPDDGQEVYDGTDPLDPNSHK
jgi:hypothetical protein